MKNLVEVITKALVDNPEGVVVTEKQAKTTVIEVHVADNDIEEKVIDKQNPRCESNRSVVRERRSRRQKSRG